MSKYINTDIALNNQLSRTAHALVLPLMLLANDNNEIAKSAFIKMVGWITDSRTWNKYWKELTNKGVLVRLDRDKWMVSPHECYTDGASHNTLINKWNEARNAIN
tara:strand:- start:914 stop:1228 length:315 start_codon:yes stop_codon:yes gene_type:complete